MFHSSQPLQPTAGEISGFSQADARQRQLSENNLVTKTDLELAFNKQSVMVIKWMTGVLLDHGEARSCYAYGSVPGAGRLLETPRQLDLSGGVQAGHFILK
jgi:hypothetical protein